MKLIFLTCEVFLMVSNLKIVSVYGLNRKVLSEFGLTTVEIIRKYGYPLEIHKTESEDGYILTLFRIPHGKNSTKIGFPVLAAHGLFTDSSELLLYGDKSLGFFLANEGYDVWLANMRGTPFSKKHKSLSEKSSKFWDFSWHEYGEYDLPAFTDYICSYTKSPDVVLVGYSMGATAAFVMASQRPEYSNKVRAEILLGPVATLKYSTSPLKLIAPIFSRSQGFFRGLSHGEFNFHNDAYKNFMKFLCNTTILQKNVCKNVVFLFTGFDYEGFDKSATLNSLVHGYISTSTKTPLHYAQLMVSGRFHQFSYGPVGNLLRYNRLYPPEYPLQAITIPTYLFTAVNDVFCTQRDVEETLKGRPFVKRIYVAPRKSFSHLDFLVGKDVTEQVYNEMSSTIRYVIGERRVGN